MGPIKAAGKYRQEGKTYVVQDGDIIHFQFSKWNQRALTFQMLMKLQMSHQRSSLLETSRLELHAFRRPIRFKHEPYTRAAV